MSGSSLGPSGAGTRGVWLSAETRTLVKCIWGGWEDEAPRWLRERVVGGTHRCPYDFNLCSFSGLETKKEC